MSYGAEICFKVVPADQVFNFFHELKTACTSKLEEIAKDNFLYLPSKRREYRETSEYHQDNANRLWMRSNVFTFRYFYLPERDLLGMFNVPSEVTNLFDKSIYFQNSCDQDYDWEVWEGIRDFEVIAQKWIDVSDETVFEKYKADHFGTEDDREDFDYNYYRKTFCYDEIWELFSQFLYQEEKVVYLSLYGGYELYEASKFCGYCQDFYNEWEESLKKRAETIAKENGNV